MKSKRALSILLALVFVLTLLPAVSAPALAATEIASVSITLDAPAVGARPDYTAVFPSGAHYYSDAYNERDFRNDILWEDVTNGTEDVDPDSGVFLAGHVYKVWIYLTAEDGYEFSSSATATVNGQTVQARMSGSQLMVEYTFPPLPEEGIVASGILDSGVYWKLDDKGTLTYFGNGEVNAPLTDAQMDYHYFKDVIIEEGVTKYDVEYDDSDYTIPESITAKGHLTDFDVESEYHYGYHIGSRRLSNIYFQGAAPDSISYSSSEEVTIWYDPDMSGWTQELIDQLSQDPNITVKAAGSPVITSYGDVGYGEGSPAVTFSVEAEGKGTLSYQWFTRESGSSIWNEVTAASGKTADYAFTPSRELELFCRVSNYLGSADSPVMCLKKVIFSQPTDQTVYAGEEVSFSVRAGGMNGITYRWYYLEPGSSEWVEVSENGTSNTLTLTAYGRFNGRQYRCRVYGSTVDSSGCWHSYPAYSRAATLTVISASAPAITTQPSNRTVAVGEKATFKVVASGTGLTYQWQYSKNGTTWTDKAGATSASYTVTAKASYNGLYYRCKVSNAGGEVFSNKARLTVTSTAAPTITTQPANKTVAAGEKATFRVVASGTGLTYQWQYSKNGTTWTDKAGATSASYTVTAKASYNGMLYRCIVTNAGGSVTSGTAKLTVTVAKPVITTQPKAQTAAVGATATYKVVASGTGLTYQWQYSNDYGKTWHNKTGATSASYTVTAKASYNGILYRCRVKNSYGTVYSSGAALTVTG